jgi:hypothetical protein
MPFSQWLLSFSQWLRRNSEHYLLIAAQERIAQQQGAREPRSPRGLRELFWLRIFAPVYSRLPWSLRHRVMLALPGSHRRQWAPPPQPRGSAVQSFVLGSSTQQERNSGHGTDRG